MKSWCRLKSWFCPTIAHKLKVFEGCCYNLNWHSYKKSPASRQHSDGSRPVSPLPTQGSPVQEKFAMQKPPSRHKYLTERKKSDVTKHMSFASKHQFANSQEKSQSTASKYKTGLLVLLFINQRQKR
ncbi:hypothetical protein MKW98_009985 [Papaver atlanticum]|uniref:Uncharacterized protein n=1 Tax=Papaver atlanticum TaxID=357466 RepID=A0AAD4T3R6_9MAGN|nr:hypothetical protein MKW98_009985 [Papaver atlanticum]